MAYSIWPDLAYSFNLSLYLMYLHSLCFNHIGSSVFWTQHGFPQIWTFTVLFPVLRWVLNFWVSVQSSCMHWWGVCWILTLQQQALPAQSFRVTALFTVFKTPHDNKFTYFTCLSVSPINITVIIANIFKHLFCATVLLLYIY